MEKNNDLKKQLILYIIFALFMILINYLIQKSNQMFFFPFICQNYGNIELIRIFYCSTMPYNMSELIGSIVAVGITYVIKFFLDKFVVFKKKELKLNQTTKEFLKYFSFAVLTTIENIGIQFLLTNFFNIILEISMIVALTIGYMTKFFLDKFFVFCD